MKKDDLLKLKEKLSKLNEYEQVQRNLYLKDFYDGKYLGPMTGYPSIDKPWLKYHTEEAISSKLDKVSMYEKLKKSNVSNMNKVALNYFGRKISYAEMFDNIDAVSSNLVYKYGIKKGDIVCIAAPTTPETIYMLYALSKIGATANMIDPRTSVEGIKNYINETNSKQLFVVDVISEKVKDIKDTTSITNVTTISPSDSLPPVIKQLYILKEKIDNKKQGKKEIGFGFKKWSDVIDYSIEKQVEIAEYDENRPVVIVHTGGTTGNPKGVMLNDFSLNAASQQCIEAGFDFKSEHSWMNIMPPFIAYGVGNGLHLPLICGMEVIIVPAFEAKKFADLLSKHKPNHMVGAPSPYEFVINNRKIKKADLSYMIAPTVGGDKMDENLERETNEFLANHGCEYKIVKGYGMTEVNAAVAACSNNEINKIGTVGLPFAKEIIAIFNPGTEEEVQLGEIGEICITGPNTMIGYYNNSEESKKVLKKHVDGKVWMHSGDIGYFDQDGQLYILDRIKRIIIRYDGFKLFPSVIENVVSSVNGVKNCSVIGVLDKEHAQGKLPYAYITLDENSSNENEIFSKVTEKCHAELPEYSQLCGIKVIDSIPYTGINKVDFRALEKEYEAKTLELKK